MIIMAPVLGSKQQKERECRLILNAGQMMPIGEKKSN